MAALFQDIRYAVRWLVANPGLAITAIGVMAVGIGANTAIFSIVDALLFRPPPFEDIERVVNLYTVDEDGFAATSSYRDLADFAAEPGLFEDVVTHEAVFLSLRKGEGAEMVMAEFVSANYFTVLGLHASRGRILGAADDAVDSEPVAVVSYAAWHNRYGADPAIVGTLVSLNGTNVTVVGVGPKRYNGSIGGLVVDFFLPVWSTAPIVQPDMTETLELRGRRGTFAKARLRPGVSVEQVQANLDVVMARLRLAFPETNEGRTVLVKPASDVRLLPQVDAMLYPVGAFLMVVVGLVLVIAASNLATLLLAKASARQKDFAIRLALGGGRRVVRQLLVESVLLASIGGVVGVGLAYGLARFIVSFKPPLPVPIAIDLGIDLRVLTFALGISLLTGIVFGLAPAINASRTNLVSALKSEVSALRVIGRRWSFRNVLVVGQIAISLVLMIVAGLFVKSMRTASHIDVGFDMDHVAMATFSVDGAGHTEEQARALYAAVLDRVTSELTVTNAALTNRVPLGALMRSVDISIDGFEPSPNREGTEIDIANISPGYFATLKVPLLEGRDFEIQDADGAQAVAIVSRAAAERFWNGDALGRTFRFEGPGGDPITIVGVAADTKVRTLGEGARPYLYVPLAQVRDPFLTIVASTRGDPSALRDVLRGSIAAIDASIPIMETKTMPEHLGLMLFLPRMGAAVISAFGVLAMLLACLGLYGVVAFGVSTRTRELGIRLALGAQPSRVTGLVMREGLRLVGAGMMLGLLFATALTFPLSRVLYGIEALAPSNYLVVGATFFGVAFLAGFLPARRATRIDPMLSLRQE